MFDYNFQMSLGEFLNICRLFRVSEMLRTGAIKSKFRDNFGVNCSEFLYQIFQTFDWYTLSEKFHCFFQVILLCLMGFVA